MISLQNYKGDETELKYREAGEALLGTIAGSLDELYEGADTTEKFLLMLYDEGRVPYSQRIKRAAFVNFIKGAMANFPFIGNFDSYAFILKEIFGQEVGLLFNVPAPGKLEIQVSTAASLIFDFIGRELTDGEYTFFNISDDEGDDLIFLGLSGIETEAELELLFSEIIPAGIFPTVSFDYFLISVFGADEGSADLDIITSFGDTIIFLEY